VLGAAVWAAGYTGIYIVIVRGQGNAPAWWYVALLTTGTGALAVAADRRRPRLPLILGTVCLALAVLAGLLSIGLLLCPRGVGCHRGGHETLMAPAHRRPVQLTPRVGCPANPIRG
jgi:hypothetical protein